MSVCLAPSVYQTTDLNEWSEIMSEVNYIKFANKYIAR